MKTRLHLLLIAAVALPACTPFVTSRAGHRYPPRPADCDVEWLNMEMAEAYPRYETVGTVAIGSSAGADVETDAKLREKVRAEACTIGADAALIGMNASGGLVPVQSSTVWLLHKRERPLTAGSIGLWGMPAAPAR